VLKSPLVRAPRFARRETACELTGTKSARKFWALPLLKSQTLKSEIAFAHAPASGSSAAVQPSSPSAREFPQAPILKSQILKSEIHRRLLWSLGIAFLVIVALNVFHAPLLSALARAWVVDEPLQKADPIVVLGGRPDLRAVEAARLYHQGIAPHILYIDVKLSPSAAIGIIPSEREQTHRLLLSNNVPEGALDAIGHDVSSTYEESRAVQAWAERAGAKSILIPTDLAHTRRARWIFRHELAPAGLQVHIRAVAAKEYGTRDWWRHEEGLIAFQNEWIKTLYYWCKY